MRTTALLVAGSIAVTGSFASMTPDAKPKDWPATPAKHVVTITRDDSSTINKQMIEAAENAQPAIHDMETAPGVTNAAAATNTWWYGEQNRIKMPFALTGDAVDYYEALVKSYQKKAWKTYCEPSSKLVYEATVKHHDSFTQDGETLTDVYVVTLKLAFSADFTEDATIGVHVDKERTVVLDAKGVVKAVKGDEKTVAPMLAI